MNNIGKKLKMENYFAVGNNGKNESLVMLQNYKTRVNITSLSNHHIDTKVETEMGKQIRCTRVYDH